MASAAPHFVYSERLEDPPPMHAGAQKVTGADPASQTGLSGPEGQALGSSLGPLLQQICQGRLADIDWFRSTWQRGGAATGFSTWTFDTGESVEVMVKLPVGPMEQSWTMRLGAIEPIAWNDATSESIPTPRVVATGEALGGYDLSWVVMERFRGHPLISRLDRDAAIKIILAAADFQARALDTSPVTIPTSCLDYRSIRTRSLEALDHGMIEHEDRWAAALDRVGQRLDDLIACWESRPIDAWCHGDLHPGNAMWRRCQDAIKRCVLIDLALIHPGHWVEDALYLERQFWGHEELLGGIEPVEALARARSALGLALDGDYRELARARRVLLASAVPSLLTREGNRKYVERALEILEGDGVASADHANRP